MFNNVIEILRGKQGLEFGGPTELFSDARHRMLLYPHVSLDGGNIFEDNHFQSMLAEAYFYGTKVGKQYNIDCADLDMIKSIPIKYDFIITSHVIEHIANPIKAIKSWIDNLLKSGSYLLTVVPDYRYCFDRKRPLTTIQHLMEDFNNDTKEDDTTHIEEQKTLHDWSYGGHKDFYKICDINYKTRVVHHHTFTPETFEEMIKLTELKSIMTFKHDDLNIVNLSIKP